MVVLTAKHHGQEAKQGVQEISLCTANGKAEHIATALVAIHSMDNQWAMMEQKELNLDKEMRGNRHMGRGRNAETRRLISPEALQLETKTKKNL